jgi:hypothetical protein
MPKLKRSIIKTSGELFLNNERKKRKLKEEALHESP